MGVLENADFVHLHLHSEYSLLDGAIRVSDIPRLAKEAGHTAAALTDHGNMFGAVEFFKACQKEDIRPIIGCEVYVAPKSRFIREAGKEGAYHHLVLLCENETGYKNLIRMVSSSYLEGFYSKPRIDMELLSGHHEGLIALSACLGGYIPSCLSRGDYDEAKAYALKLDELFGRGNFYLEMQDHLLGLEKEVNRGIRRLSAETGIPTVITNDAHYPKRRDADTQAVLLCIGTNSVISDGRPLGFETDEFYYKTTAEMEALFPDDTEALRNTAKIAKRCSFSFTFDKLYLPVFRTPDASAPADYLRRLTEEGFVARQSSGALVFDETHPKSEYRERIEYELSVIIRMGYAEYYLIVWDFVHYAKGAGIPVGPGRGSGAGSLVAYLIGITDVDSIRFQLMFERFLNPERVSMPDFDIDFSDTRRGEVIEYVKRRYGEDHVAQIITFGTLAARAAVRDVGRALGMPYADVDMIAKTIPQELGMTLEKALEEPALKELYENDESVRRLIRAAKALEGMPRHASTHAAGVVITDLPVTEYVPLAENSGQPVTQYDMDTVAALGLLKIDFLGLRYLSVIADAEEQIRERIPDFDITRVPFDDAATYAMISQGKTAGVFQLESRGMRAMLTQMEPYSLEMIVAAISLYRPGPMDSIPKFIENAKHPEKITYPTPVLKDILDVTFGCIVYQEQVMQICRAVAGYSYARADLVRRAMAKKKTAVMEEERQYFLYGKKNEAGECEIPGALAMGVPEDVAAALFDDMASFAKYAFNKSHASAYAFTSYRTAYLKRHFPGEYFSALLTSVSGSMGKTAEYIAEAARFGIPMLAPDINESHRYYHVAQKDGRLCIRFGLLAVKNVGVRFVEEILCERAERKFTDFEDFVCRMSTRECSKRQIEALIRCGAFDSLPQRRSQLLACFELIVDDWTARAKTTVTGQMDLFSAIEERGDTPVPDRVIEGYRYPDLPEISLKDKLLMERDTTGQYFSGHLLDGYEKHAKAISPVQIADILSSFEEDGESAETEREGMFRDRQTVTVVGIVGAVVKKSTKKGDPMAFAAIEDRYAAIEAVIFPKIYEKAAAFLGTDTAVAVTGEISAKEEELPKLLARSVIPLIPDTEYVQTPPKTDVPKDTPVPQRTAAQRAKKPRSDTPIPDDPRVLYLRVPDTAESEKFLRAVNLCEIFSGTTPVVYYREDTKTYEKQRSSPVGLTPYVLYLLEELLGRENVIVK